MKSSGILGLLALLTLFTTSTGYGYLRYPSGQLYTSTGLLSAYPTHLTTGPYYAPLAEYEAHRSPLYSDYSYALERPHFYRTKRGGIFSTIAGFFRTILKALLPNWLLYSLGLIPYYYY